MLSFLVLSFLVLSFLVLSVLVLSFLVIIASEQAEKEDQGDFVYLETDFVQSG